MNERGNRLTKTQYGVRNTFFGLLIIVLVYLVLAIAFTQVMPFSRALDEGYHLEYISFIKQYGRLPITYEERAQITRADFPPLYQLLVGLLSIKVNASDPPQEKFFWDSFRYRAIDHQTDAVWTLATEDYQWPYFGWFLVWQIGRWLSVVLSATTVIIVFLTLRDTPLGQYPLAVLAGTALLAFIPRYIILGSALNDDNLLGLLAALYFWLLVKAVNQPRRWWPFVGLGLCLGLSMTVKYTLVLIPLEIMAVCLLLAKQQKLGWVWAWRRIGVVGGLALLGSSWWFGWNIWFLNTVAADGWLVGLVRPLLQGGHDTTMNRLSGLASGGQAGLTVLPEGTSVGTFSQWLQSTFLSFWGVASSNALPLSPYAYLGIGLVLVIAAFGLVRLWQTDPGARTWLVLFIFHTSLFFILPLLRFGLTRRLSVAAQGRHILIPAATAIVALLIWGLLAVIPPRWQRFAFGMIIAGFIGWTGAHLHQFATPAVPPLPLRTLPQAAEWLPDPANARFGDSIELVTYEVTPQPANGLLQVNLAWRALAHVNESYLLKVELVNSDEQVVSHWLGYNGQGRVPTLAWDPGDVVFDHLALPLLNLPAAEYNLRVQMLGQAGPLPVITAENLQSAALALTGVVLQTPAALPLTRRMSIEANTSPLEVAFELWQSEGPVKETSIPVYRYPGTISVIVANHRFDETVLKLELVAETGQVWPANKNEPGIYTFIVGPRWQSGMYRLRMTLQRSSNVIGQSTSEPLLAVENWWERRFEAPEIQIPLTANFANQLLLLGYKLPHRQVKAGESFPLTLYWQALPERAPQADFIQFNHLLDGDGNLRGGYDRRPLEYYSTLLWAPGEVVVDGYAIPVEAGAPPGEYWLDVGYYITVGESAVNLPLVVAGQMTELSSVTIGPIEVVVP